MGGINCRQSVFATAYLLLVLTGCDNGSVASQPPESFVTSKSEQQAIIEPICKELIRGNQLRADALFDELGDLWFEVRGVIHSTGYEDDVRIWAHIRRDTGEDSDWYWVWSFVFSPEYSSRISEIPSWPDGQSVTFRGHVTYVNVNGLTRVTVLESAEIVSP